MTVKESLSRIGQIKIPYPQKLLPVVKQTTLIGGTIGLGCLLGVLLTSPSSELIIALVSSSAFLLVPLANPLYGLVFVIITHPLSDHFAIIELGAGIPNMSPYRLAVAFVTTLLLLRAATAIKKPRYTSISIGLASLFFVIGYSLSFHNNYFTPSRAVQFILDMWILPIIIYFVISNLIDDRQKLNVTLHFLLILGVYSALYMIYEQTTGNILFEVKDTFKNFYRGSNLRIVRGLYGTTTVFGNLLNLLIPIDIYYFLRARTSGKKMWYLLAFGIMVVGVFLTYKRAVWLGMLLSFLIIQFLYPKFRRFFVIILIFFVIGIAASWDSVSNSEVITFRVTETDDWENANGRTERWEAGLEFWKKNPIFGSGFRCYEDGPYKQVENLYIHLLASAGLITFVPFLAILFTVLRDSIRIFRQTGKNAKLFVDRNLIAVFLGAFAAYFFMAYFGSGLEGRSVSNVILFTIIGTLVGSQVPLLTRPARNSATKQKGADPI